jgi:uncharacterized membrane protein (UPF0127 family)
MESARLQGLPRRLVLAREVAVATGPRARLLGLARLDRGEAGTGLLIPHCASVHTFGMRFSLDMFFLDRHGAPLAAHRGVPPRKLLWRRGAAAVLELPAAELCASEGGEFSPPAT